MTLAFCFALFLGLAVVTQGQAEEYYIYQGPNGELVISNKQPPPGSKIIKQQNLPEVTDDEVPKPKSQVKRSQTDRQNAHRSRPRINSAIALLAGYVQKAQSLEKIFHRIQRCDGKQLA